MSLTIKAVLKKVGEQDEIRRFSIDTDVSANYGYLLQKISQTFPNLKGGSFSLFWKGNALLYSVELTSGHYVRPFLEW